MAGSIRYGAHERCSSPHAPHAVPPPFMSPIRQLSSPHAAKRQGGPMQARRRMYSIRIFPPAFFLLISIASGVLSYIPHCLYQFVRRFSHRHSFFHNVVPIYFHLSASRYHFPCPSTSVSRGPCTPPSRRSYGAPKRERLGSPGP